MTTFEKNTLLAEYLGAKKNKQGAYEMYGFIEDIIDHPDEQHFFRPHDMRFDHSYDWLMYVVHKIEDEGYAINMMKRAVSIHEENGKMVVDLGGPDSTLTTFQALYEACAEFVLWYNKRYNLKIDMSRDQVLLSIRRGGECLGYIEAEDGKIVTTGVIGENTYDNFVELIKGLQGFGIHVDNFYW